MRVYYTLASDRVGDLWAAVREVAVRHVAEVNVLADEYLGERDGVEHVSAAELRERLARGDVVVLDVRPEPEYRAGHACSTSARARASSSTPTPARSSRTRDRRHQRFGARGTTLKAFRPESGRVEVGSDPAYGDSASRGRCTDRLRVRTSGVAAELIEGGGVVEPPLRSSAGEALHGQRRRPMPAATDSMRA
jgi:hypothetical protein